MEDVRLIVSRRLRELRKAAGLSQDELARASGNMSLSYLGALERGEKSVGVETLERLARALNVEVVEFFTAKATGQPGKRRPTPEERLARLVAALAKGADKKAVEKFEKLAR